MPDTETIAISFESVDTDFPVVLGSEVLAGIERIQVDRFHQLGAGRFKLKQMKPKIT